MAYTVATQLTAGDQSKFYASIVADIVCFVARDLTHSAGGFFSAEDADSWPEAERDASTSTGAPGHKKEGAFCVWTAAEIRATLGEQTVPGAKNNLTLADLIVDKYHVKERGNVDPSGDPHGELRGQNVLTELPLDGSGSGSSSQLLADQPELYESALSRAKELLFERRLQRPRPDRDDKVSFFHFATGILAVCRVFYFCLPIYFLSSFFFICLIRKLYRHKYIYKYLL